MTFALLPPRNLKGDDRLDWLDDRFYAILSLFPRLWDPRFDADFREVVSGQLQRAFEQIRQEYDTLRAPVAITLTLKRVDFDELYLRGDYRYSSEKLAEVVASGYDLVPIASGRGHLFDGHHRWRAYELAGVKPLVLDVDVKKSRNPEIRVKVGKLARR